MLISILSLTSTLWIILPIGVSFNSFQSISYAIAVYRGTTSCEKKYYNYLAYTTLFPQIIAGPIVRYVTVENDLDDHKITHNSFSIGMRRFIIGLGKKVLIANNVGLIWSQISGGTAGEESVLLYWIGLIAYTFQIYFALILILEKYFVLKLLDKLAGFFQHLYTILLVMISWVIFYFEDLRSVKAYLGGMFGLGQIPLYNNQALYYLLSYSMIFALAAYFSTPHFKKVLNATETTSKKYVFVFYGSVAYLVDSTYNPFLYFRF